MSPIFRSPPMLGIAVATALWFSAAPARAVVGGETSNGALARSSVMVLTSNGGVCSAVVISQDVVLTAAHCASGAEQYRIHYRDDGNQPVMIEPQDKALHSAYVSSAIKSRSRSIDLALFKLKQPLPDRFSTARLSEERPRAGAKLTIGGYGLARSNDERSSGTFRTAQLEVTEPYGPGRILIWANGEKTRGACNGDSGGPMVFDGSVVAVTAWATGTKQSPCGDMTQGILLGPQRKWIDSTLAGWSRKARWSE